MGWEVDSNGFQYYLDDVNPSVVISAGGAYEDPAVMPTPIPIADLPISVLELPPKPPPINGIDWRWSDTLQRWILQESLLPPSQPLDVVTVTIPGAFGGDASARYTSPIEGFGDPLTPYEPSPTLIMPGIVMPEQPAPAGTVVWDPNAPLIPVEGIPGPGSNFPDTPYVPPGSGDPPPTTIWQAPIMTGIAGIPDKIQSMFDAEFMKWMLLMILATRNN